MSAITLINAPVGEIDLAEAAGGSMLPAGRTGAGPYDQRLTLYNAKPANLRKWRTALAAAQKGTAPAKLLIKGDSITVGYPSDGVANYRLGAWPELLRQRIATKYGNAGTGMLYVRGDADSREGSSGTWSQVTTGYGAFGTRTHTSSSTTAYRTFTPDVPVDSFSFWCWVPNAAQTIAWSIDGGAETVIDVQAAAGGTGVVKKFTVSAGASGIHALKLRVNSGTVYLWAYEGTNGTAGVRVTRLAKGSTQAANLATTTNGNGSSLKAAYLSQPDLSIIAFGHNESLGIPSATTSAAFQTAMQTLITEAKLTGDVILQTQVPNSNTALTPSQLSLNQAVYSLADANGCAVLDIGDRWGLYASMPAAMYADATHPSNQGLADIASAYFDALTLGL